MKFISILLPAFFLMALNLSNCQDKKGKQVMQDTLIKISLNDQFDISLESNNSAGYAWFIEPFDTSAITLIDSTSSTKNPQYPIGSPKIRTYTFQGLQKGEYQLVFYYKRPWLDDIERKESYKILIE